MTLTKKEKQAIAAKKWYDKNRDKISANRKGMRSDEHILYYLNNKEKILKNTILWQKQNIEKVREYQRRSKKNFPERNLYNKAKERSKKSGIEFTITVEDIVIPEICPLLNIKLDPWGHKDFVPSLDRKDNSLGYTKQNIWVISFKANRMKNTASYEELNTFSNNWLKLYKDLI